MQGIFSSCKENGLEVNAEKTKYMVMSRHQNAGQSHTIKISNSSFERDCDFILFGCVMLATLM
jgi:hypothetical protein